MYTLRHTLFLSDISTYLSHLHHLTMGVAKSILYATPSTRVDTKVEGETMKGILKS